MKYLKTYENIEWDFEEFDEEEDTNFLNESPDRVYDENENEVCSLNDADSLAFGIYNGKMYFGKIHDVLYDLPYTSRMRYKLKYPGRLWFKQKIISFWVYPPKEEIDDILDQIKIELKKLRINVNWDKYFIEIVKNNVPGKIKPWDNMRPGMFNKLSSDSYTSPVFVCSCIF